MRILLIHNRYLEPGGEDAVFAAEARLLRSEGHEVFTFVEENRRLLGIPPLRAALGAVWSQDAYRRLRALLRETRPHVVHCHNTFLRVSPAAYYASRAAGVPVVQTLHNYRLICPGATLRRGDQVCEACVGRLPWRGVLYGCWQGSRGRTAVAAATLVLHRALRTWSRVVDGYIALTDFARRKFIAGGLPAERLFVKPNFVDPDPGPGEHRGEYALFVGRLSAEKGLATLLAAWARLPEVPLRILGDGPLAQTVRETARRRRLRQVRLEGPAPPAQVHRAMQEARLLVFPSVWYEGFPLVLAEALACGLPVVASRLGAAAEILTEGRTGLLFRPADPADLAACVRQLWADPARRARMGAAARREFEARYTAQKNAAQLLQVYEEVLRRRTRQPRSAVPLPQ